MFGRLLQKKLQTASDKNMQAARSFAAAILCIKYQLGKMSSSEDVRAQIKKLHLYIIDFLKTWVGKFSGQFVYRESVSDQLDEMKVL